MRTVRASMQQDIDMAVDSFWGPYLYIELDFTAERNNIPYELEAIQPWFWRGSG
jgi:hypothetical protein